LPETKPFLSVLPLLKSLFVVPVKERMQKKNKRGTKIEKKHVSKNKTITMAQKA